MTKSKTAHNIYSLFASFSLCILIPALVCCQNNHKEQEQQSAIPVAESIQVKGSDTIVNLCQVWAEEFAKLYPDVNIGVTGGGSGTGFAALLNGTCDLAMSSRSAEDKELKQAAEKNLKLYEYIVGLDGLAVIVHPDNPLARLTLKDLKAIFTGTVKNWLELGGRNKKIVLLSRESNSGTHLFFKEHVLRGGNKKNKDEFAPQALLMPSSQAIVNEVVQNPYCIGYVGMGYISNQLRALSVAQTKEKPYVAPTVDNVMDNSYPVSRPLYLYTTSEPQGAVKSFIDYAMSAEGQQIVRKLDFVPVK